MCLKMFMVIWLSNFNLSGFRKFVFKEKITTWFWYVHTNDLNSALMRKHCQYSDIAE